MRALEEPKSETPVLATILPIQFWEEAITRASIFLQKYKIKKGMQVGIQGELQETQLQIAIYLNLMTSHS